MGKVTSNTESSCPAEHVETFQLNKGKPKKNHRKVESEESEEELDYNDTIDLHGEAELLGQFGSEEDSKNSRETGECDSSGDSSDEKEDYDSQIKKCVATGNISRLKQILKLKEEKVKKLQKEVRKEMVDSRRRKEIKCLLEKIEKTDKTAASLQHSLANSKENSPAASPV